MFRWENKFSAETLLEGKFYELNGEIDEVIKVNNQYYGSLDYGKYKVNIKLTKKEDKITKMTCNCKSKKRNCKHLVAVLYNIEDNEITEKTFKHNSITKYPILNKVKFEKYLEEDIEDIDECKLREFIVNLIIDYDNIYENYITSFKDKLNKNDTDIILKRFNKILKLDIGISKNDDKFMDNLNEFLNNQMITYSNYPEIFFEIYINIYEKISSTKFLLDSTDYELILDNLNTDIINNLNNYPEYKESIKSRLKEIYNNYPNTLFTKQIIDLMEELSDDDIDNTLNILLNKIDSCDDSSKEEYLVQLIELLDNNDYSDDEKIRILEEYSNNFIIIQNLLPYYEKKGHEQKGICALEIFLNNVDLYDEDRYYALVELKNLQCKVKNLNNFKFLMIKLMVEYDYYNEDDFDKFKKYDPKWIEFKDEIISLYKQYSLSNLYSFYIYNNMTKEFEDDIFQYQNMDLLYEYQDVLRKICPERLMEEYEIIIYELLRVAKRSKYRKVAKILTRMKELPNSSVNIRRIINDLKEKYPQRKALVAELENV